MTLVLYAASLDVHTCTLLGSHCEQVKCTTNSLYNNTTTGMTNLAMETRKRSSMPSSCVRAIAGKIDSACTPDMVSTEGDSPKSVQKIAANATTMDRSTGACDVTDHHHHAVLYTLTPRLIHPL